MGIDVRIPVLVYLDTVCVTTLVPVFVVVKVIIWVQLKSSRAGDSAETRSVETRRAGGKVTIRAEIKSEAITA